MANKNDISRKTLKYYAKMASETYVDDPVYKFAAKMSLSVKDSYTIGFF